MQLSDLIKSKIDLYGISFGIGSGNLRKAGKQPRVRKTISDGAKAKPKHGNTKASKTQAGNKAAKVPKVAKKGKLTMGAKALKVCKSGKVGTNKALKVLNARKVKAKGKKITHKRKNLTTSKKHVKKRK